MIQLTPAEAEEWRRYAEAEGGRLTGCTRPHRLERIQHIRPDRYRYATCGGEVNGTGARWCRAGLRDAAHDWN